jgi:hypothetical protein
VEGSDSRPISYGVLKFTSNVSLQFRQLHDELLTKYHSGGQVKGKTENKMGGRRPVRCITSPRNTRMEETRWGMRIVGASFEEWMDGCSRQRGRHWWSMLHVFGVNRNA